ncbi:BAR-domain-containing protein [Gloeophyllum trabeum ATCC 11539]|uniref:BAR-domain-containing protein n=1 Tax=Gloeophyllum trabeum (strain ATCC 11539 / FP-39264 / Madison 617) TaxID=670483 RepID=S7RMJ1_GLOTA|nr:BAR-domain-containing protein [Gloeophyllum trabeum ATCC 11539]EPQ55660.1 BAR-domain-containing protein [Gloeophyllum trabeum ATCC 11539]
MASKQLGKLRQWAGEVISSRERTVVTEEFRELEEDIDLRKEGIHRLHIASQSYHHALSKKRECEAVEEPGKFLPVDALGVVMITHGEELGEDSVLGSALVKFGRAHCKVATLQEALALTFQDTFLTAMQRYEDEIKDYQALRKKLESRRLSYDAAINRMEKLKTSKKDKEKEKAEAEDELAKAKSRYEETFEDVRAIMFAIQENETSQIRDLTSFLEHEMNFVEQYLEVLKDTKANWVEVPSIIRSKAGTLRSKAPSPSPHDRRGSIRSHKSSASRSSRPPSPSSEEEEEDDAQTPGPNRQSFARRKSDASKVPSRTPSRASRKRADSEVATDKEDKEKEKEREKGHSKRLSMAGWASSAVGSITGRSKKDKDKFATLKETDGTQSDEDESDGARSEVSRSSRFSSKSASKKSKSKKEAVAMGKSVSAPQPGGRKMMKALYDFTASSADELSFRAGDVITVQAEVLEGWWMGELRGRTGLFPTTYTEPLATPPVPPRPGRAGTTSSSSSLSSSKEHYGTPKGSDGYESSDGGQEALYSRQPVMSARTPVYGAFDVESIQSSVGDGDEEAKLMPGGPNTDDSHTNNTTSSSLKKSSLLAPVMNNRVRSDPSPTPGKRPPPPPPPARRGTKVGGAQGSDTSSTSERRLSSLRSNSVGSVAALANVVAPGQVHESPFDSPKDSSFESFH